MPPRALALVVLGALGVARVSATWTPPLLPLSALDAARPANGPRRAARALFAMTGLVGGDAAQAEVHHFRGGLYGVVASVALDLGTRHANVTLRGAPLGGTLGGQGWLVAERANAYAGAVVLDPDFRRRLERRFVRVLRAAYDPSASTVTVVVTVPVFGTTNLVLARVEAPL